jgi:hypothetical protein
MVRLRFLALCAAIAALPATAAAATPEPYTGLREPTFPSRAWHIVSSDGNKSETIVDADFPRQTVTVARKAVTLDVHAAATAEGASLAHLGATQIASRDETICTNVPAVVLDYVAPLKEAAAKATVEEVLFVEGGVLSRTVYFRPVGEAAAPGILETLRTGCTPLPAPPFSVGFVPPSSGVWVQREAGGSVPAGTRVYESEGYVGQRIAVFAVRSPLAIADYVRTKVLPGANVAVSVSQNTASICGGQPAIVLSYTTAVTPTTPTLAIEEVVTRIGDAIVSAAAFRPAADPLAPGVDAALRGLCPTR